MPASKVAAQQPLVAIAILNYNGADYLERFLPSVLQTTYPNVQLFVIDNGSTDDSIDRLKKWGFERFMATADQPFPPAQSADRKIPRYYIDLPENYGFAEGYNRGLAQLQHADYYVLLNSDVEVSPDWVEPLIHCLEKSPQRAAAQPKILMEAQRNLFEYAGAAGGWMDHWGYPFCRGRIFSELEEDQGQYDQTQEVFWASGAALCVRSQLYHQFGGLDADFFAHMEEIDFCWRLKKGNYQIYVCPKSKVWHVGGGTLPPNNPRKDYLNFRNSLVCLLKNLEGGPKLFLLLYWRLLLDGLAAIRFLKDGKWGSIAAIVKAHWHFFFAFPKHWKKRAEIKERLAAYAYQKTPRFNTAGYLRKSIVWLHFAKKVKTFKDIEQ